MAPAQAGAGRGDYFAELRAEQSATVPEARPALQLLEAPERGAPPPRAGAVARPARRGRPPKPNAKRGNRTLEEHRRAYVEAAERYAHQRRGVDAADCANALRHLVEYARASGKLGQLLPAELRQALQQQLLSADEVRALMPGVQPAAPAPAPAPAAAPAEFPPRPLRPRLPRPPRRRRSPLPRPLRPRLPRPPRSLPRSLPLPPSSSWAWTWKR
ncbi:hypothetical protein ACN28S_23920 [Cystobacter fuscus]